MTPHLYTHVKEDSLTALKFSWPPAHVVSDDTVGDNWPLRVARNKEHEKIVELLSKRAEKRKKENSKLAYENNKIIILIFYLS